MKRKSFLERRKKRVTGLTTALAAAGGVDKEQVLSGGATSAMVGFCPLRQVWRSRRLSLQKRNPVMYGFLQLLISSAGCDKFVCTFQQLRVVLVDCPGKVLLCG